MRSFFDTNTYDALSRLTTESNAFGTVSYGWNAAGRNSHITYPGTGLFVNYDYDILGRVKKIRENGATSGAGVLAQILYNDKGARTHLIRGNGHITTYAQDGLTASLNHDAAGTADDLNLSFEFNPAGQMTSKTRSNTSYDWDISTLEASSFMINGLNQAIDMYSGPVSYDARGNLTAHSGKSYDYDIFNNLTSVSGTGISVALDYDAKGRLAEENSANGIVQFAYAGSALIAEYDSSNTLLRRYVHGPGSDEPIAVYEGSGTASKFYMMADHQGSIIGYTDSAGTVTDKNSYSPEGVPDAANVGRFGYTGQMWLAEAELYHYKARAYDPQLGRFLQADPIGYGDGLNMYAYVGGDAVNSRDPSGLSRIRRVRPIDCPPGSGADACGQRTGGGGGGWTSYRPTLGSWSPISYGPGGTGLLGGSGPGVIQVADAGDGEEDSEGDNETKEEQCRTDNPFKDPDDFNDAPLVQDGNVRFGGVNLIGPSVGRSRQYAFDRNGNGINPDGVIDNIPFYDGPDRSGNGIPDHLEGGHIDLRIGGRRVSLFSRRTTPEQNHRFAITVSCTLMS